MQKIRFGLIERGVAVLKSRLKRSSGVVDRCLLLIALAGASVLDAYSPAHAQTYLTGTIGCDISYAGSGSMFGTDTWTYAHHETQTWTLDGFAPQVDGSQLIYGAQWNTTGVGYYHSEEFGQSWDSKWTIDAQGPVEFEIHFDQPNNQWVVNKWKSGLSAYNAVQLVQEVIPGHGPDYSQEGWHEYELPKIEVPQAEFVLGGGRLGGKKVQLLFHTGRMIGRRTYLAEPAWAFMKPSNATGTISCLYNLKEK